MRHNTWRPRLTACCLPLLLGAANAAAQSEPHAAHPTPSAAAAEAAAPPLYTTLGSHRRPITTFRDDAQAYFDQGLRWMHAFNLEEAEASFREAARRDPSCAMCRWGVAFALGPHINLPALPERTAAAAREIAEAVRLAATGPQAATETERALIAAMARRSSDPPPAGPEQQRALDEGYAEAMRAAASRFPEDAEVAFLTAEALMDLHPWDLWTSAGEAKPWTPEILATIARGLARDPAHPGLHHLHIHAVEASPQPERAIDSADRLREAMPGAGHMVHMPGHIYMRVGRYADAALANERAAAVDGSYLPGASPNVAFYRMLYVPHNIDFLAAAAQMEGRSSAALLATRALAPHLGPEMLREMPGFDFLLNRAAWTLLHFGRYAEVLAEPPPPEDFPYASAMAQAARGLALVRMGRLEEAGAALRVAEQRMGEVKENAPQGLNPARPLGSIGVDLLAGELLIAGAGGAAEAIDSGLARLRRAVATEDGIVYNEPPDWYFPTRHLLGAALLRLDRGAEAERTWREDLDRNRENGWALAGLAAALDRQGKSAEAERTRARLAVAWARADLGLERVAAGR